ncbi:MAG: ribonuclease HI [Alphaproteobacteria bacterium]|nr:ribonuclease HI [Alphaproteobacteria bacterium]
MPQSFPEWTKETLQDFLMAGDFPFLQGLVVRIDALEVGACTLTASVDAGHLRPGGTVSGPTQFCIADIALYGAVLTVLPDPVTSVTSDMAIRFLRRPAEGAITATARLLRYGARSAVGTVELSDAQGHLIAYVTGGYASSSPPSSSSPSPSVVSSSSPAKSIEKSRETVEAPPTPAPPTSHRAETYTVYCDGSCLSNPSGPGGWAYVLHPPIGDTIEGFAHLASTTNNRAELEAAIQALRVIPEKASVTVYTDSEYVVKGMQQWIHNWIRKNWRTSSGSKVKNADLWENLLVLAQQRHVQWEWVKGHAGNVHNERADFLAQGAARRSL